MTAMDKRPSCLDGVERALERLREVQAAIAADAAASGIPTAFTAPRPKLTLIKGGKDG